MWAKYSESYLFAFLALLAILLGNCCGSSSPTGPEPPPPAEISYTLQIQYVRPSVNPDLAMSWPIISLFDMSGNRTGITGISKVDDYHFNVTLPGVKARGYYFFCLDDGRYDGSDTSSVMVGDVFIVTVKETGIAYELKDIRPYTLSTNPYPGPKAKAAFFQLTSDGKIVSVPQP